MSESAAVAVTPASALSPDYSTCSEIDLFEGMAQRAVRRAEAHACFAEFHRRHAAYLVAVCQRRYRSEAEEIVAETLRRVYDSAAQFDRQAITPLADATALRRLVRAWMGRIVGWVAADHFAARSKRVPTVALSALAPVIDSDRREELREDLVLQVRAVLESLSEREQEIAWTLAHGWNPDHGSPRWSRDDLEAIATRYGMTPENLRQVRSRLIHKLRERLSPLLDSQSSGH